MNGYSEAEGWLRLGLAGSLIWHYRNSELSKGRVMATLSCSSVLVLWCIARMETEAANESDALVWTTP